MAKLGAVPKMNYAYINIRKDTERSDENQTYSPYRKKMHDPEPDSKILHQFLQKQNFKKRIDTAMS